jgi:hypothetical protein
MLRPRTIIWALYGCNLTVQNPKVGWRSHYLPRVNFKVFERFLQLEA